MTFELIASTTLLDVGFLQLDRVDVRAPDGELLERHVVRHPGAVVVVPVDDDDHVIMVRQYRAAVGGDLLEVPAGKRDVDGEAPDATARRELEEEIGCVAGSLHALCEFYNSPGFTDEYTFLFLATDLQVTERAAVSAEEAAMEIVRVPLASIDELIARRELVDAKSIIGVLAARAFLSGASGAHPSSGPGAPEV
ncbi:MAG: NUDIX hydrolase [Acidimicrobiia bacterium]